MTTPPDAAALADPMERLLAAMREPGLSIPGDPAYLMEIQDKADANRQFDTWCRANADAILAALRAKPMSALPPAPPESGGPHLPSKPQPYAGRMMG